MAKQAWSSIGEGEVDLRGKAFASTLSAGVILYWTRLSYEVFPFPSGVVDIVSGITANVLAIVMIMMWLYVAIGIAIEILGLTKLPLEGYVSLWFLGTSFIVANLCLFAYVVRLASGTDNPGYPDPW